MNLTHAHQKLKSSEDFQNYVTITTHRGLYRYTRLPFGVFQKVIDTILQGLPKVICYLDDIIVFGNTEEQNLNNVEHGCCYSNSMVSNLRKQNLFPLQHSVIFGPLSGCYRLAHIRQ